MLKIIFAGIAVVLVPASVILAGLVALSLGVGYFKLHGDRAKECAMAFDWGGLVSGIIGGIHNRNDELSGREGARDEQANRDHQYRHFVEDRVTDAKNAGIHPLYALGANAPSFSPVQFPQSDAGFAADIGRAVNSFANRDALEKAQENAQEKHDVEIEVLRSEARKNDAVAQAAVDSVVARSNQPGTSPVKPGQISGKADEVVSARQGDPSLGAGMHPAMREYIVGEHGLKMRLPFTEEGPGESLENISWWQWPAIIQHNRSYYGDDWGTRFLSEFVFGNAPEYRQYPRSSPYSPSADEVGPYGSSR